MMKPMISPAKGGLHPALSEGCGLWKPISVPVGSQGKPPHPVSGAMDNLPLGDSVADVEIVASPPRVKP